MEIPIILNTSNGQVSFQTEKIIGKLDGLVIDSDSKVEIIIQSIHGYTLFHRKEYIGLEYYCPRNRVCTPIENIYDYLTFDKFNLNEEIIITIIGSKNQQIGFIFKIEE